MCITCRVKVACEEGHLHIAEWLFEMGASRDVVTKSNRNATPMMRALLGGHLRMMQWLFTVGAADEIRNKDDDGATPMMWACYKGHLHVAQWLFTVGAAEDIRTQSNNGWTPFMAACHAGHFEVMRWLFEVGADGDTHVPAHDGQTPWSKAVNAHRGDMLPWLLLNNAAANDQGHVDPRRLDLDDRTRNQLQVSLIHLLDAHATFIRLVVAAVTLPSRFNPAHRSPLRLLQGHRETLLPRIAEFVGILVKRKLRNAREASFFLAGDFKILEST